MKTLFKNTSIGLTTALVGLSLGCSAPDSGKQTEPNHELQAGITAQIAEPTYAADRASKITVDDAAKTTVFTNGDKIGVYLVEYDVADAAQTNLLASGNQTDNHLYTYSGSAWTAANLPNPLTWRKYNAFAYHPHSASVTNALAIKHTVRTDQSGGVVAADYFMWSGRSAAVTPIKGNPFVLNFTHGLTRLIVNVSLPTTYNGEMITGISGVTTVAFPVATTLNLLTGTTTPDGTKGTVKMSRLDDKSAPRTGKFAAVVVPTTVAQYQPVVQIDYTTQTGTGTLYYYAPTGGITFAANQIYTLTLDAKELIFSTELTPFIATSAPDQTTAVVTSDLALTWSLKSDDTWITFSIDNGTTFVSSVSGQTGASPVGVKVRVANNATGQPRLGTLTLSSTDPLYNGVPRQLVVRQN